MAQQLMARIKRTSKYHHQSPEKDGGWFEIHVSPDIGGHSLDGNWNRYRFCDVKLGLRLEDGKIIELPAR